MEKTIDFSVLLGLTLISITTDDAGMSERIVFETTGGRRFELYHDQDCCEHVYVESIVGDLNDLLDYPILQAEEVQNPDDAPDPPPAISEYDSSTWTFYKLATVRGYVTIRWFGTSNGYYSERVSFVEVLNSELKGEIKCLP